jgi:hypothetical protein
VFDYPHWHIFFFLNLCYCFVFRTATRRENNGVLCAKSMGTYRYRASRLGYIKLGDLTRCMVMILSVGPALDCLEFCLETGFDCAGMACLD